MGRTRNTTDAKTIELAERREMAMDLRKQGASYEEIALTLRGQEGISPKYDKTQAHDDVMHCLREIKDRTMADVEEVRALELERLDALMYPQWLKAIDGNGMALANVLQIMDRRAKYLGLYAAGAPQQIIHASDPSKPVKVEGKVNFEPDPKLIADTIGILASRGLLDSVADAGPEEQPAS